MASSLQASNADNEPIGVQVRMELRLPRVSVRRQEDRRATLWLLFLSAPMLIFLVWPLVALVTRIPLSLLIENLSNLEVIQAIRLSLTTTALSTSTAASKAAGVRSGRFSSATRASGVGAYSSTASEPRAGLSRRRDV